LDLLWLSVGQTIVLNSPFGDFMVAYDSKGKQVAKAEGLGDVWLAGTLKVAGKPAVVVTATDPKAFGASTVIAYTISGP
jgi:hypothetical protein